MDGSIREGCKDIGVDDSAKMSPVGVNFLLALLDFRSPTAYISQYGTLLYLVFIWGAKDIKFPTSA